MLITHSPGRHMLVLTDSEASILMDACALLVLASDSYPEAALTLAWRRFSAESFRDLKRKLNPLPFNGFS